MINRGDRRHRALGPRDQHCLLRRTRQPPWNAASTSARMFSPASAGYRIAEDLVFRVGYGCLDPLPFGRPLRGSIPRRHRLVVGDRVDLGWYNQMTRGFGHRDARRQHRIHDLPLNIDMGTAQPWGGMLTAAISKAGTPPWSASCPSTCWAASAMSPPAPSTR